MALQRSTFCELLAESQLNVSSCWAVIFFVVSRPRRTGSSDGRVVSVACALTDWHRLCVDTWPRRLRR